MTTWHAGSLPGSNVELVRRFDGVTWAVLFNSRDTPEKKEPVGLIDPKLWEAAVDGNGGNLVTFDGSRWTPPVTIDSTAANSDKTPVLVFLMSVSCPSARLCVAGDTTGDVFILRGRR